MNARQHRGELVSLAAVLGAGALALGTDDLRRRHRDADDREHACDRDADLGGARQPTPQPRRDGGDLRHRLVTREPQQALQLTPLGGVGAAGPSEGLQAALVVLRGLLVSGTPGRLASRGDRVFGGLTGIAVVGRFGEVVREFLCRASPRASSAWATRAWSLARRAAARPSYVVRRTSACLNT